MISSREYDEAITIFSPDGRLYQVEYALELVKRGAPVAGVTSPEGIVLVANETVETSLQDPRYSWKIFQLDEHVGATIAGLGSDARVLIEQARLLCQQNKLLYDEPLDVEFLARTISDQAQTYTQYAGVRPFGVSMIFGGVDKTGCRLFTTDPSGSYKGYMATALGRKSEEAIAVLDKEYRDNLSLQESLDLALRTVKTASEAEVTSKVIKAAVIPARTRLFRRLTNEEIDSRLAQS